jgi:hypothetical protein
MPVAILAQANAHANFSSVMPRTAKRAISAMLIRAFSP